MDIKFNGYEYHMIRKFTSMCYGSRCNVIDRIKIRNKISVWHEILTYLLSPDGVLNIYKVECSPGENNNLATSDSHPNYVIKRKLKTVMRGNEGHAVRANISLDLSNPLQDHPSYIEEAIENYPLRLLTFLKIELNQYRRSLNIPYSTPLSRYLQRYNIVEMHLDNILKSVDDSKLPFEIFQCPNVKILSLKHNHLRQIPSAIGRLSKLEVLILTDNLLTVQSIPFSLKFCVNLKELYVDDNQLEALPGFLTSMKHLELVYRLGNRNYFKSFFLWYHTDYDHRARKEIWKNYWIRGEAGSRPAVSSLLDICVEKIFSSGINFFNEEIPESLKHYMSLTYLNYNICNFCNVATDCSKPGYSTVTFLTPYLGNTCVPFQHWACSKECVLAIEGPAKKLQLEGAERLDHEYSHYIAASNKTAEKSNMKLKRNKCCIS
ncbi:uncharacterized protein LOC100162005 [Acyrthosiphon pisum]|uniref:Uncharacterized protein n=1 Tax=Acyrthosiphon pisum TaxID=7029 RepID=A0A8R2A8A3_ACYPI|nr:uncharacterized protein LOC100162005 [Acyrthosiphon pisum]|eukprot:XP_001945717.2 PREDICTED: uncharacterized protein LOC100162005 [Acyrthosiphon pisum]